VVAAGHRHFKRPLGVCLAFDLGKIDLISLTHTRPLTARCRLRRNRPLPGKMGDRFSERSHRNDTNSFHNGSLQRIAVRDKERTTGPAKGQGNGQCAVDGTHASIERELAKRDNRSEPEGVELTGGGENPEGDGEIEHPAFLLHVCRGEIDGEPLGGQVELTVDEGRADPLPGLLHRLVGQTHDGEGRQSPCGIHLDVNRKCL